MNTPATVVQNPPSGLSRFKRYYVMLYMNLAFVGMVYAGYRVIADPSQWGWIGVLLATVPYAITLGRAMMFKNIARTDEHMMTNIYSGFQC